MKSFGTPPDEGDPAPPELAAVVDVVPMSATPGDPGVLPQAVTANSRAKSPNVAAAGDHERPP
jgi:hypothetical protein